MALKWELKRCQSPAHIHTFTFVCVCVLGAVQCGRYSVGVELRVADVRLPWRGRPGCSTFLLFSFILCSQSVPLSVPSAAQPNQAAAPPICRCCCCRDHACGQRQQQQQQRGAWEVFFFQASAGRAGRKQIRRIRLGHIWLCRKFKLM